MSVAREHLDTQGFKQALTDAGAWSKALRVLESVGSTNDELRQWAEADAPDWAVVVAEVQTAGRGRRGRSWASPPGQNLYLSLRSPVLSDSGLWPCLPILAAVAVADTLSGSGVDVHLKWPNDLLAPSGAKLGGILVERVGGRREVAVIGIGLNVNARAEDLVDGATSLRLAYQRVWNRNRLAGRLVASLQSRWQILIEQGFAPLAQAWTQRALWLGEQVQIIGESGELTGRLRGIDELGRLCLSTREGQRLLASGEVSLRPKE